MTTRQETPSVSELLRRKRDGGFKAPIYRELDVSPQTYDWWESRDGYTPGYEYAEALAEYLEIPLKEFLWILYKDWVAKKGLSVHPILGLTTHRVLAAVA